MVETDRRTRGRLRRRDQVYAAAVELFVERGFDSTTMDDIAERSDVARATVFNYFPRKTALLDEWSARRRHRALTAVRSEHLEDHSVEEILRRYMVELGRVSSETRPETVRLLGAAAHATNILRKPPLAEEFTRFLARGQESGEVRASVDVSLAGLVLAASYFIILTNWIDDDPPPFDLTEQLLRMLDQYLVGILAPGTRRSPRRSDG
ncbi:transcriptional regulator, TetR family [Nocardioides terrae]|uniref:Transcriptional regulator, TetR family n=1 Tax=Nocardioides terrae TaxID=574651 RepID=A0A1I1F3J1_9ACTN|nr:TetR/AcrR family transcriptional regulator [Nocardioides terrae]SFB93526.1 transcriptional regulator, TetR family [Nocardioides terrae]